MKASGREVELSRKPLHNLEAFMSHANAALTPKARLKIARLIVDEHWPIVRAAERFDVSWPTAKRWADRYRIAGEAGMDDRSSRPHHQPNKTSDKLQGS
jgi:transposase